MCVAELLEYSQTKMRSANVAAAETDQLDDDEDDIHVESKSNVVLPSPSTVLSLPFVKTSIILR